ncbi:MAG: DUF11 domain-containing protein [Candidatus Dormibacteraeota bacterium]|uniref:DUF11 domain-containing protein n=1 Tax=Candidatus Amunia macphersoniae TaxID=3127014 RepID=A0A934KIZ3_9BACT|nr:DUF11 domain-containing protein [Candidatus Dormibacteraeota bacterium]
MTTRGRALLAGAVALCFAAIPATALAATSRHAPTAATGAVLTVHIYQVGTSSEVPNGNVVVDNPLGISTSANPFLNVPVPPGQSSAVSAAAPSGWTFVDNPAQPDGITNNGTAASLIGGVTVPLGQTGTVVFYATRPLPVAHLTMAETVDRSTAPVGTTLTYTITLRNTGTLPAVNMAVDDTFGGDAGFLVNDGTQGTASSWMGAPLTTVTKVTTGHYRWTYAAVNPGDTDIVSFTTVVRPPSNPARGGGNATLANTVSSPGVPAASVTTTTPYAAGGGQGAPGRVPSAGTDLDVTMTVFLVLGGLGLIQLGVLARKRVH